MDLLSNGLVGWLAAIASVCSLLRFLPAQNVTVIAVGVFAVEVAWQWRWPPDHWAKPAAGLAVVICARGVARLMLRRQRDNKIYGFWLIGLASLLAAGFHAAWQSGSGGKIFAAIFLARLGGTALILILLTPWFIRKRPGPELDDYNPLRTWLGLNVLLEAIVVQRNFWWLAAGLGMVNVAILIMTGPLVSILRGNHRQ